MSADQPLTGDELATIRARCEAALRDRSPQRATVLATRLTYDVPRLVAEIERLRVIVSRGNRPVPGPHIPIAAPDYTMRVNFAHEPLPDRNTRATVVDCL